MKSKQQKLQEVKERLQSLGKVINELNAKYVFYGHQYGLTRNDEWYTKRKYAREGHKMAKAEFSRLERKYRILKGGEK